MADFTERGSVEGTTALTDTERLVKGLMGLGTFLVSCAKYRRANGPLGAYAPELLELGSELRRGAEVIGAGGQDATLVRATTVLRQVTTTIREMSSAIAGADDADPALGLPVFAVTAAQLSELCGAVLREKTHEAIRAMSRR